MFWSVVSHIFTRLYFFDTERARENTTQLVKTYRDKHLIQSIYKLEIVITRAAPAFHKLFMVTGCVFDINTVHKTVEKLTFQAFY